VISGEGGGQMSQRESGSYVISYMNLRRAVGVIGILLPVVLRLGVIAFGHAVPYSVSGYYYSPMRNVLVASLCILGAFLITYNGYDRLDSWITNVAGGAAIGVAFLPTSDPSFSPAWVGQVHPYFAGVAMISLALMSLQFTQTKAAAGTGGGPGWLQVIKRLGLALFFRYAGPENPRTDRKKIRDRIYSLCAWLILMGVVLAFVQNYWPDSVKAVTQWLFWFEALAIVAFGFSWLVKGEAILADPLASQSGDRADRAESDPVPA
jgi:hypothetical protein